MNESCFVLTRRTWLLATSQKLLALWQILGVWFMTTMLFHVAAVLDALSDPHIAVYPCLLNFLCCLLSFSVTGILHVCRGHPVIYDTGNALRQIDELRGVEGLGQTARGGSGRRKKENVGVGRWEDRRKWQIVSRNRLCITSQHCLS